MVELLTNSGATPTVEHGTAKPQSASPPPPVVLRPSEQCSGSPPRASSFWKANYEVYGIQKLSKVALRAGEVVGRDQVARLMRELGIAGARRHKLARLMRELGIAGARRHKRVRTTRADERAARHPDLVDRRFMASRPNQLWVTDLTYMPTWAGVAYVGFIVDVFSRTIVGWRAAANMRTDMVLDALEMARWSRGTKLPGLVCHSDAGSQFTAVRFGERLAELGARPSIRSVGDWSDCEIVRCRRAAA